MHEHRHTEEVHLQKKQKSHISLFLANGNKWKVATTVASPHFFYITKTKEIGRGIALSGRGFWTRAIIFSSFSYQPKHIIWLPSVRSSTNTHFMAGETWKCLPSTGKNVRWKMSLSSVEPNFTQNIDVRFLKIVIFQKLNKSKINS